ncbi:MAG: hypothetical protein PHD25_02065, partial [Bacteroidales bacterium]|nr:hypothetical protein [Bacteroidales bacterium]
LGQIEKPAGYVKVMLTLLTPGTWEKTGGEKNEYKDDPIRYKSRTTPGPGKYYKGQALTADDFQPGEGRTVPEEPRTPGEPPKTPMPDGKSTGDKDQAWRSMQGPLFPYEEIMWDPIPPWANPEYIWTSFLQCKYYFKPNHYVPK